MLCLLSLPPDVVPLRPHIRTYVLQLYGFSRYRVRDAPVSEQKDIHNFSLLNWNRRIHLYPSKMDKHPRILLLA
jgi:hypothetical protein